MFKFVTLLAFVACTVSGEVFLAKPKPDGRIVGGVSVDIKDYGYQVSLQRSGSHYCGASIISSTWALTAAHCLYGSGTSGLTVRAGTSTHTSGGTTHRVAQIIVHPQYNDNTSDNDVALVKLQDPFVLNGKSVRPVDLIGSGIETPAGASLFVTGWGATTEGGFLPTKLQGVSVPCVDQNTCNSKYSQFGGVGPSMICAGLDQGGKDACQGDSGGPLVDEFGRLVGVVSWGYGCARRDYPGVYARVAYPNVRSFIKSNTGL